MSAYGIECQTDGPSERNEREVSTVDRDSHYTPLPPPDAPIEVDEPGAADGCAGLFTDLANTEEQALVDFVAEELRELERN